MTSTPLKPISLRFRTAADLHPMHPIYPASLAEGPMTNQAQSNSDRGAKSVGTIEAVRRCAKTPSNISPVTMERENDTAL
jgi:hypothetical protein